MASARTAGFVVATLGAQPATAVDSCAAAPRSLFHVATDTKPSAPGSAATRASTAS